MNCLPPDDGHSGHAYVGEGDVQLAQSTSAGPLGDPVVRLKAHLIGLGEWSEAHHRAAQEEAQESVRAAGREAERSGVLGAEGAWARETMFEDVFKDMPWHLRQQRDEQES